MNVIIYAAMAAALSSCTIESKSKLVSIDSANIIIEDVLGTKAWIITDKKTGVRYLSFNSGLVKMEEKK